MSDLKFRPLNADEIDVKICKINKGGIGLLLYKNARVDMAILDETVGPLNWQRHHLRDNANCIVSLWDDTKKQWIEKEDTGKESFDEKEKGLASDSFKRACTNLGIGRELYTAPDIFIFKEKLKSYKDDGTTQICYDKFKVSEIGYDNTNSKNITLLKICLVENNGNLTEVFSYDKRKTSSVATTTPEPKAATTNTAASTSAIIEDAEVILMGNCKGRLYGEVKDSVVFKKFVKWAKEHTCTYTDPAQVAQFEKFKKLEVE